MMLKPLDKSSLSEKTAEALKRYIIGNSLKPGDKLPTEKELSQLLEISRPSLREGLRYLESLGILESNKRGGRVLKEFEFTTLLDNMSFAFRFADKELAEILDARRMLEIGAIRWSIERITPEEIKLLEKSLDMMGTDIDSLEIQAKGDLLFHKTLIHAAKNEIIENFGSILDKFFRLVGPVVERGGASKKEYEFILREHGRMLNLIKEKRIDEMTELLSEHLSRYEQLFERNGKNSSLTLNDLEICSAIDKL